MADIVPYLERIRARFEQPETRQHFKALLELFSSCLLTSNVTLR